MCKCFGSLIQTISITCHSLVEPYILPAYIDEDYYLVVLRIRETLMVSLPCQPFSSTCRLRALTRHLWLMYLYNDKIIHTKKNPEWRCRNWQQLVARGWNFSR